MIAVNPVLARELRERMRGPRAAVIITVYLLILSGILFLVYQSEAGGAGDPFGALGATRVALVGRSIFEWVLFFMLLLVLFLVPGLTSGAIAGERERQTLIPLQVTLLKPRSIILGKIGSSTAFIALLVVAAMPLLALAYLIGGVTIAQVLAAVAGVLVTAMVLAAITITCSTFLRRVQTATVLAYGITLTMVLGTFLALAAAALVDASRGNDDVDPASILLLPNPIVAVADVIGGPQDVFGSGANSPFDPIREIIRDDPFAFEQDFGPNAAGTDDGFTFSFWLQSLLLMSGLSVLAVLLSSRRLTTPSARDR